MKIQTKDTTIDVFPIRKVRITHQCEDWPYDDFHRVCQDDITYDRDKTIGLNQQQATLILNQMRHSNTDVMGNGKDFFTVRGNTLIPIHHYSFSKL
tara:strand:+ start:4210 stop:4497 length:288 start_codon:yes stop_codon:yes gene_type:complete